MGSFAPETDANDAAIMSDPARLFSQRVQRWEPGASKSMDGLAYSVEPRAEYTAEMAKAQ